MMSIELIKISNPKNSEFEFLIFKTKTKLQQNNTLEFPWHIIGLLSLILDTSATWFEWHMCWDRQKEKTLYFWRKITPFFKKWSCLAPKIFSPFSPKMLLFFEKIVKWKNIQNLISIKKVIFIFIARCLALQKRLGLQKWSFFSENYSSFWKNCNFLKKLLNNKIFNTSFMIKKVMLMFGARRLLSLKNYEMHPQNSFSQFSLKVLLFSKTLLNKKIFST